MRPLRAELAWCAGAIAVTCLLAGVALQLWDADLRVPWSYSGDANLNQIAVKAMLDHGWFLRNPDLAAPFGQVLDEYPFAAANAMALMRGIGLFTSDSALVMNLFFLLTFPLTVVASYAAARMLGVSRPASAFVGVLYTLLPYHFLRGELHLFIAAYYAVPLSVVLVVTTLQGRRVSLALVAAFAVVIGSSHVYYAAFAVILLALAAALEMAGGNRRAAADGALAALLIVLVAGAVHAPTAVYRAQHGVNHALERDRDESELFGLKITQMTLPVADHRIGPLRRVRDRYLRESGGQSDEGRTQALGLVATAGLAGLLVLALVGLAGSDRARRRPEPLAAVAIAALLLGTTGAGSSLISYLVTAQFRAWGRISVLIAFVGLLAVAMAADRLSARRGPTVALAALAALLAIGFLDQTNASSVPDYAAIRAEYRQDRALVGNIETRLPAGSAVFELPYEPFPEARVLWRANDSKEYRMGRPYIHSSHLRWSFGLIKGRQGDWQAALAQQPPALVARAVAAAGFNGMYVDRAEYVDSGAYVLTQLAKETGAPVLLASGTTGPAFIDLREYAARLRARGDVAPLRAAVLRPVTVTYDSGFSALRQSATARFHLAEQRSAVSFHNPYSNPRTAIFAATLVPAAPHAAVAQLTLPGGARERIPVPARGAPLKRRLTLPPGDSRLEIAMNAAPQYAFPEVTRPYYLRVEEPVLMDSAFVPFGSLPQDRRAAAFLSPFGTI